MRGFVLLSLIVMAFEHVNAGKRVNAESVAMTPIPRPVEFVADIRQSIPFGPSTDVMVECDDDDAVAWLREHFSAWYGEDGPTLSVGATGLEIPGGEESYALVADASGIRIAAHTLVGVRYAAYTMRQLVIAKRGTLRRSG